VQLHQALGLWQAQQQQQQQRQRRLQGLHWGVLRGLLLLKLLRRGRASNQGLHWRQWEGPMPLQQGSGWFLGLLLLLLLLGGQAGGGQRAA
jgi:hypothetical protein